MLRVLAPFAVGYFLSYLFRTVNAVISPDLVRAMGLSAADLGLLTSAYFFSFALFQLPLGVLLDRFGARRVEAALLLIAALGALTFAASASATGLTLGRALIGLGVSGCLMAGFTACAQWFRPAQIPAVNAIIFSAGGLGALTATTPVEAALHFTDWRGLFVGLAVLSLVVALLIFAVVPERLRRQSPSSLHVQLAEIATIFRSPQFWRIAPAATATQAAFMAIQGLWAAPWLRDVGGLSRESTAGYLFWIAICTFAGQLSWGIMAFRLAPRGITPLLLLRIGMGGFLLVQCGLVLQLTALLRPLWLAFGFFGVVGSLSYPLIAQQFPAELAGRANTAVNVLVFVFAFAAQWAVGAIIDTWPRVGDGYGANAYAVSFGVVLVVQIAAFVWLLVFGRASSSAAVKVNRT
jgi:predicted MFS family arabinose efflux permease